MAKTTQISNEQVPSDAILVTTEKFTGTITFKTGTHTAYGMTGIYPSSKTTYSVNNAVPLTKKVKGIVIYKTPKKEKFILASSISSISCYTSVSIWVFVLEYGWPSYVEKRYRYSLSKPVSVAR